MEVPINIDDSVDAFASRQMIERAAIAAAAFRGYLRGEIGVRVTDDATIRELNRTHLGHDYATDVISFGYQADDDYLSGELVVSADTAAQLANPDWPAAAELLLYVVHGTLHIAGMDDHDKADRILMRQAEQSIMTDLGFDNIQQHGADQHGADQHGADQATPTLDVSNHGKGPSR